MPIKSRASKGLAWFAVVLGALEFATRAIARTRDNWLCDLVPPYVSSRLWLAGLNPYDPSVSLQTWYASGATVRLNSDLAAAVYSVYPPPTLLLMVPLGLLPWHAAFYAFMAIGLLLYTAVVYGLVRLGWPEHRTLAKLVQDPNAMLFVAFSLGFAPIHTAFHSVNIVLFACCAAILAVLVWARSADTAGYISSPGTPQRGPQSASYPLSIGLLVGFFAAAAICLKPTTGIFLIPWLVRERRWRWLTGIVAACAVVTLLSLAPMLAHQGISWLPDYRQNVNALFTHGGNADVSAENSDNTDRIDLQLLGYAAFGSRTVASAAAAAVYVCLLLVFLGRAGWRKEGVLRSAWEQPLDLPLLVASGCLALGLLPSYSRVYAAVVLLPLVLWCFRHLQFSAARWLLLLLCDFLLNTSAVARLIGEKVGLISRSPRLWDLSIGGHTCWLLLAIGCLLIHAVHQQTGEDALKPVPLLPAS